MKFAAKMTLAVTLLLAISLSVAGTVLVSQNFNSSLDAAIEQNINQHVMERYSLETELVNTTQQPTDENLVRYGASFSGYVGEGRRMVAYYDDGLNEVYVNFAAYVPKADRTALLSGGEDSYIIINYDDADKVIMLISSYVQSARRNIWLVSGGDISRVFIQRDAQMQNLWRIGGIVLVLGIVAVALLSHLLTRPINRLNRASRRIAGGALNVRTGVHTSDEIGELAGNFDIMAAAVQAKVDDLNLSVQKRDDFVSAFTHELKTPMTSIIGYSDILRSMELDADTRHIAANHIFHEAQRLEVLSRQLLELMGLAESEVVLSPIKLAAIFATAYRSLQPLPQGITLNFVPCGGLYVNANRSLAADLLRNLILNAIKAAPRDGVVSILLRIEAQNCVVTVQDTGCGIPENEISRITEPFYMVDKSRARQAGGSGVGLALCQRIAQIHGSSLIIESEVGVGTEVSFILPIIKAGDIT